MISNSKPKVRQRGFVLISNASICAAIVVVAALGWGVVELARWALSHVHLSIA
jgi:hypothetical protein